MHSQTCPSIAKSAIEVIPRKRNAKIRGKPETKSWNLLRFGIRNLQWQNPEFSTWNPESTAWNPESNTVLDYLTWGEIAGGAIQPLFEQTDLRVTGFYEYFDVNIYLHNRKLAQFNFDGFIDTCKC